MNLWPSRKTVEAVVERPYTPNRAERRAAEQRRARQQRKGQRAYDRSNRDA